MRTKLDIYVCITITGSIPLLVDYQYRVDISAGGLSVPEGIIRLVISVSALLWLIRYIYYSYLQFLNNIIIIKTKVVLLQRHVTLVDCGDVVYVLWFIYSKKTIKLLGFPIVCL